MCGAVEQYHTAYFRAAAPVIYHRLNNDAGGFTSTEANRSFVTSVHEAKIPPVIAQLSIFAFDSRFSKPMYRLACVNTFSRLDCLVVSLHDILDTHIWFIMWEVLPEANKGQKEKARSSLQAFKCYF